MKPHGLRIGTSLRIRFLLVAGVVLLSASLGQAFLFFRQSRDHLELEVEKRGATLAGMLAAETWVVTEYGEGIPSGDADGRTDFADPTADLTRDPDVAFALVQDVEGRTLGFHADTGLDMELIPGPVVRPTPYTIVPMIRLRNPHGVEIITFTVPVCRNHYPHDETTNREDRRGPCEIVALARVGVAPDRIMSAVTESLWWGLAIAILATGIGMAGVLVLARWTLRPLSKVARAARAVAQGELGTRLEEAGDAEIAELAKAFNEMTWGLADSREELARRHSELQMVAQEKERLYQNAQVRATRLQVLNELAKAMASSLNPDEIYGHVQRQLSRLMQYEYLTVQRYLPETHEFRRDYIWMDRSAAGPKVNERFSAEGSPVRRVQHTKMPLFIPDFEKEPTLATGWLAKAGYSSGFIVPIMARDEFLGILGLACRHKNAFARMEVATVFAIADTLAVVLKNTELYQKLQAYVEELTETQHRLAKSENVRRAEKLRSVGQMASGIAHNFNNVMSAIIGRVQLLRMKIGRDEFVLDELEDGLLVIERAALDGAETVRRLQEFSRGQKADQFEKTDLNELVQSVIEITRPRWKDQPEQRGVHIEMRTKYSELPPVACVPSQLREALTNLIFNSVDAMPRGGRILIETEQDGSLAVIRFSDSGVGMPGDVRDRVFDPFFTTKGVKGSGLGLSTVYGIVERHAGEITVVSDPGQGATFILKLPLAKAGAKRARIEDMMASKPWRILVGDDEPNVREALADLLRLLGHDVETAHDGKSTVKLFQTGTFDMVFTDLGMPDMTGWEVTEAIREIDAEVPIVLATGWGSEIDEAAAQNRGVTRVLAKPFTVQKISSLVAELQGRRQAA